MNPAYKVSLLNLSAYYDKVLTDQQIKIYADQLAEFLTPEELTAAVKIYINDPQNEFFPRPISKLIALIKEPLKPIDLTQQAAGLIKQAVVQKQSAWPVGYFWGKHPDSGEDLFYFEGKTKTFLTWREAAEDYFGSLGLAMIDHLGGWQRVCEMFNTTQESVVWAQLLKAGESVIAIYKHERQNTLPELPAKSKEVLKLVSIKTV